MVKISNLNIRHMHMIRQINQIWQVLNSKNSESDASQLKFFEIHDIRITDSLVGP